MPEKQIPDSTAVRVALWRALHVQIDSAPHILKDEIGLKLAAPDEGWQKRPDMHPQGTSGYRASIVSRARFVEDLVAEQLARGVHQYVILGAGLDTFVQRKPEYATKLHVFEIDQPETQKWKKQRLIDLGFGVPKHLHFVPVDFEVGESWLEKLKANGFDAKKPAVIVSTGVSLYLTKEANVATLREITKLASGTQFAMTFMLPPALIKDAAERAQYEMVMERAKVAGTPFLSFFSPAEIVALAREAGFRDVKHISGTDLSGRYFSERTDGLRLASGEEFIVATV